jgi:carbamoyltransferase
MNILGLTRPAHDPAAALLVDGEVAAAAEEERFRREKHAPGRAPLAAARYCLSRAGLESADVDLVAYPWSLEQYLRNRWTFAWNHRHMPRSAFRALAGTRRRWQREMDSLRETLGALGFDPERTRKVFVPHHMAHAASAFHLSGMSEAAVLSVDAMGEFDTLLLARGSAAGIEPLGTRILPDSLGTFYTAFTEYLGLVPNDGEFKLMGMAPYGDPDRVDLSPFIEGTGPDFRVDPLHVFPPSRMRDGARYHSRGFAERLGPPRRDEGLGEPYVHVAAAVQKRLEDILTAIVREELRPALDASGGNLCLAGGVALNVRANGALLRLPFVRRLFVQPAANDAGGALGAAAWAARRAGVRVGPLRHVYLGPAFDARDIRRVLQSRKLPFRKPGNLEEVVARLLRRGEPVARFDGGMEWGPRALGNRSILAHPGLAGTADRVNRRIKFREPWRPFCPVLRAERAREILGTDHPCPWMTLSFRMQDPWPERLSEVVHVDGTTRPQVLERGANPRLYRILELFEELTGLPALMNTSFNLRGEPVVCTPEDALRTFFASGLRHLAIGPYLVSKSAE